MHRLLLLLCFLALPSLILFFPPLIIRQGTVLDANGPVHDVSVGLQGTAQRALSTPTGHFQLIPSPSHRVVAFKPAYRIAWTNFRDQPWHLFLQPLPQQDNEDYEWVDPAPHPERAHQCANCHAEIYQEWNTSAHARSTRNPHFLEIYGGSSPSWNLAKEYPEGAGVCASCHAPTLRSPTLDYDMRHVEGVAGHGVHCDYCHKVVEAPVDKLGTRFGRDGLQLLRPGQKDFLFFGPLDDAVRPGESFGYSPLYKRSEYCASCHEGILFGVHVYGTYSEWRASPAAQKGQQCQTCHMAPTGMMTNFAPGKGGIERAPLTLASHSLPGATSEMLRRCLQVDIKTQRQESGTMVAVTLRADHVGHRVPTGFIDRHLLLVVDAFDQGGKRVLLLEGTSLGPETGQDFRGLPGWLFAKQLRDAKGRGPLPFWVPHEKMLDTRLLPGKINQHAFRFPGTLTQVRVRLLYRRFWPQVALERGWNDNELVILDKTLPVH